MNAQNSDDLFSIVPAHLLHELDAGNKVTSAARTQEQAVPLNEESRHRDSLGIRYSVSRHVSMIIQESGL